MPYKDLAVRKANQKATSRKHYLRNKNNKEFTEKLEAGKKAARLRCKQMVAAFRGHGCIVCEEDQPCCIDAHHLIPAQKEFSIGMGVASRSVGRLAHELEKCVPLCRNCHTKLHAGLLDLAVHARVVPPNLRRFLGQA